MFLFPDIARNQQHRQHHPRRYEQYQAHQTHAQDPPSHKVRQNERSTEIPKNCLNTQTDRAKNTPKPIPTCCFSTQNPSGAILPRSSSPQFLHLLPRSECILLAPLADLRRRGNILPPNQEMRSRGIKHVYPAIKRSYRHPYQTRYPKRIFAPKSKRNTQPKNSKISCHW